MHPEIKTANAQKSVFDLELAAPARVSPIFVFCTHSSVSLDVNLAALPGMARDLSVKAIDGLKVAGHGPLASKRDL